LRAAAQRANELADQFANDSNQKQD
jgi:hypothetical protein